MSADHLDFKLSGPQTRTPEVTKFEKKIRDDYLAVVVIKSSGCSGKQCSGKQWSLHPAHHVRICLHID